MDHSFRLEDFTENGFAIIPSFYDLRNDIAPICEGIRQIVELVARKYGIDAPTSTPELAMGPGYNAVVGADRQWGTEIYDAVKQLPAFVRLVANPRNTELFAQLRPGSIPGLAGAGHGIRIDLPGEERFRSHWHQEFPFQLRSLDGIVFWSPLVAVTPAMGPVQIALGSHREGMVPIVPVDLGHGKTEGYLYYMHEEERHVARYEHRAPCTSPGDLIVIDFLTMHQSGFNESDTARWTMQFRLFNFAERTGTRIGWRGSFASHTNFAEVLPELAVPEE